MKFTVNTAKLHALLSKVQKGVGNSKVMPITEYIKIEFEAGTLFITATDMSNFITVKAEEIEGEDGTAIVKADAFIKLVAKTTKETMTVTSADNCIEVKGNGKYKIPTIEDEFPTYTFDNTVSKTEVDTQVLKKALQVNKSAIAYEMLMPCLTGFNIGDMVVTTDGVKMCINNVNIFSSEILLPQTLAELITSLTEEKVIIQKDENKLLFTTDSIIIFGAELDGIGDYPDILPILDIDYSSMVVVQKHDIVQALDRLSIFVDVFDNSGVTLTFNVGTLTIEDLKQNSKEEIEMEQHVKEQEAGAKLTVNIDYLKDLINAVTGSKVQFQYGDGMPLKIVEDNVTFILSTMIVEQEVAE